MTAPALPINARVLPPDEIARSFVPPQPTYSGILGRNHHVIFGPRGSGKTTLLSMLTQPAQRVWRQTHRDAPDLSYIGVLVRADLTWSRQLRVLARSTTATFRTSVIQAVYVDHCTVNLLRYLKDYIRNLESDVVMKLGGHAEIERTIGARIGPACGFLHDTESFALIKDNIAKRSQNIWFGARRGEVAESEHYGRDIFEISALSVDALEDMGIRQSIALLLDELELVPRTIRNYLVEGLRDSDERVLLKLSLSPVEGAVEEFFHPVPAAGQDFVPVDLTYPLKTQGYGFTDSLLTNLARRVGNNAGTALELLGRSSFDLTPGRQAKLRSYSTKGDLRTAFRKLRDQDPTFANYLARHDVDLDSRDLTADEFERAAVVRKVRDIVLVRARYRNDRGDDSDASRRAAKSLLFYAGHQSVLALLEGNPRWAVNFVASALSDSADTRPLRPARQGIALADVSASIRSRVATSPIPLDEAIEVDPQRGRRILSLLDTIGSYFRVRTILGEFDADPPLTFVVDSGITNDVASLVSDAVSHGAVIHLPRRKAAGPMRSVRGQRFRLAYILGAEYQLPPILGREVNLSTILTRSVGSDEEMKRPEEIVPDSQQMRLFS